MEMGVRRSETTSFGEQKPGDGDPFVCAHVDGACGKKQPLDSPAGAPFPEMWCPRGEFVEYVEKPLPALPDEFMSSFHSGKDHELRVIAASSAVGTAASTKILANAAVCAFTLQNMRVAQIMGARRLLDHGADPAVAMEHRTFVAHDHLLTDDGSCGKISFRIEDPVHKVRPPPNLKPYTPHTQQCTLNPVSRSARM